MDIAVPYAECISRKSTVILWYVGIAGMGYLKMIKRRTNWLNTMNFEFIRSMCASGQKCENCDRVNKFKQKLMER